MIKTCVKFNLQCLKNCRNVDLAHQIDFLRMAFVEACKKIGIEIEFAEKRVFNLPKDIMDDIGKLVSIAACYDKDTAKHYAEKLDQVLKTEE